MNTDMILCLSILNVSSTHPSFSYMTHAIRRDNEFFAYLELPEMHDEHDNFDDMIVLISFTR